MLILYQKHPDTLMMRERVSTTGVLRPLEPEPELPALNLSAEYIGAVNEGVARRYIEGQARWEKKFGKTARKIEAKREKNLELAKMEMIKSVVSAELLRYFDLVFDCDGVGTIARAFIP